MKKKREFYLNVFVIAFDNAEAEQIAKRDGAKYNMRFYEYSHSTKCEGFTYCNVYKVKKLPSIKELKKQIQGPDIDRIIQAGTDFE